MDPVGTSIVLVALVTITVGVLPMMMAMPSRPSGRQTDVPREPRRPEEEAGEAAGLPDGSDDRAEEPAARRKVLAMLAGFSYLIVLFLAILVILVIYAFTTR